MKFRAKRKYGNEVITGYYNAIDGVHHYIFNNDNLNSPDWFEIDHTTLAMSTGVTDKNGVEIFGSVPVDGIGMSKGGDMLTNIARKIEGVMKWSVSGAGFWIDYGKNGAASLKANEEVEITGKQYEI